MGAHETWGAVLILVARARHRKRSGLEAPGRWFPSLIASSLSTRAYQKKRNNGGRMLPLMREKCCAQTVSLWGRNRISLSWNREMKRKVKNNSRFQIQTLRKSRNRLGPKPSLDNDILMGPNLGFVEDFPNLFLTAGPYLKKSERKVLSGCGKG